MYDIEEISNHINGGYGYQVFKIINFDENIENLKKFIEELNEKSNFWINWRIINEKAGIIEKEIDPLD